MSESLIDGMFRRAHRHTMECAANGHGNTFTDPPEVVEPKHWEEIRLIMQGRLRAFTGEPDAILHFEFPANASL